MGDDLLNRMQIGLQQTSPVVDVDPGPKVRA